jgi:hypothetical protein
MSDGTAAEQARAALLHTEEAKRLAKENDERLAALAKKQAEIEAAQRKTEQGG